MNILDDLTPGPDSYQADHSLIGKTHSFSKIKNSPGIKIGRAKLETGARIMISSEHKVHLLGKESPGVGNYNIDQRYIDRYVKKNISPSFNFSKAKRFSPSPEDNQGRSKPLVNLTELFSGVKSPRPQAVDPIPEINDIARARKASVE